MMDACVSLMNQYSMIAAQFPPIPSDATTSTQNTDQTSATKPVVDETIKNENDPATSEEIQKSKEDETDSEEAGPSTSQKSNSIESIEIDGNVITIEDIGRIDPNESAEVTELRRRRLQKFELKAEDS